MPNKGSPFTHQRPLTDHPILPPKTDQTSLTTTLTADLVSAITSSALVAPLIAIIDKSIIANASGIQPLRQGIVSGLHSLLTRPLSFCRQPAFLLIWGVYAGTYTVANTVESICIHRNYDWYFPKFIASSVTNISLSVAKDRVFARMFGKSASHSLPLGSYLLFGARDSLTVLAGFNLPYTLSKQLQSKFRVHQQTADISAQLTVPCAIQFLSCPLHLVGLDLYNRPAATPAERWKLVRAEYLKTALARVGRIFPAYGIGGVVNKSCRKRLNKLFQ